MGNGTKPGWRTSEFWIALLTTAGGLATTATQNTKWGVIVSAATAAAYAFARTFAKR